MRWPWTKPEPIPAPYVPTHELEDLHARLRTLDDGLHEVRRELKGIQTEWHGQFSKYQALYARLAKQAKRAEQAAEDDAGMTNGNGEGVQGPPLPNLGLRFRRL